MFVIFITYLAFHFFLAIFVQSSSLSCQIVIFSWFLWVTVIFNIRVTSEKSNIAKPKYLFACFPLHYCVH